MLSVVVTAESNEADDDLNEWMFKVPRGTNDLPLSKECSTSRLMWPVPEMPARMSSSSLPVSQDPSTKTAANTNNTLIFIKYLQNL